MKRRLRLLMLCLLMVCVPLQGYAASRGSCCATAPELVWRADGPAATSADAPCPQHVSEGKPVATTPNALLKQCHACMFCGLGPTAPPPVIELPLPDSLRPAAPSPTAAIFLSVIPSRIDRPPKAVPFLYFRGASGEAN